MDNRYEGETIDIDNNDNYYNIIIKNIIFNTTLIS